MRVREREREIFDCGKSRILTDAVHHDIHVALNLCGFSF